MSSASRDACKTAAASLENGSVESPWNDLVQSTCEGSSSVSVNGLSSRFSRERVLEAVDTGVLEVVGTACGDDAVLGGWDVVLAASACRAADCVKIVRSVTPVRRDRRDA